MTRKKINILLIIAVSLIWGVVLYKYITPFFAKKEVVFVDDHFVAPQTHIQKKDTVALILSERDPFLGKISSGEKIATVVKKAIKVGVKKNEPPITWPKIEYMGFVKSESSKERLGLIRIDGKLYRVYNNSNVKNLKIKDIGSEKIKIVNAKEERTFKKL